MDAVLLTRIWNPSRGEEPSLTAVDLARRPVASVLDVGCGDGRNLLPFVASAHLVVGIDADFSSVQNAKQRLASYQSVKLIAARLPALPLDRPFEVVLCHGVLHFMSRQQRDTGIRRLQEVTAPGGRLSIVAFNSRVDIPNDLKELMPEPGRDSGELLSHFHDWELVSWSSYDYADSHDEGRVQHVHAIDRLVARKP